MFNRLLKRGGKIAKRDNDIVMFHLGRCGSTVLGNMLDQHPDITWASEIFNPYMNVKQEIKDRKFVRTIISESRAKARSRYYGFETKYLPEQHLSKYCINMALGEYIKFLEENGFKKFILLHRKNYLRRAISASVGSKTSKWHVHDKPSKPVKVIINTKAFRTGVEEDTLLNLFNKSDRSYQAINDLLKAKDSVSLIYEKDIMDDPKIAYKKVIKFLGLEYRSPKIKYFRTNPFALDQLVENYDEVFNELKDTKYSWMLND